MRTCASLHHENPEVFIEINPEDAHRLNLKQGEKVKNKQWDSLVAEAGMTERVRPGVVFIPVQYLENAVIRLTNAALDAATKTPEYKVCGVHLSKMS